jgi:wyosine [tRNA(Phe)-imidazoG37] synthetase (radical SAM superfamily)
MITFGPVTSRRLGRSLGINNIPPKACSYSCVYCQVGPTRDPEITPRALYAPQEILRSVAERLEALAQRGERVDWLTFVPDGEATLDANLGEAIDRLRAFGIPIAVISNASLAWRDDVRAALAKADWLSLKVDATDPAAWRRVNRPCPALSLDAILDGIARLASDYRGTLTTETMLVAGVNDTAETVGGVAEYLGRLAPAVAHLAVPTRPPAEPGVCPPNEMTLVRAYELFRARVPRVQYLIGDEGSAFASSGPAESELLAITAVHPLREEALRSLLANARAQWPVVERLLAAGTLRRVEYQGQRFCVRTLRSTADG